VNIYLLNKIGTQPSLVASSLAFAFSILAMRAVDLEPRTLPPQWRRIWGENWNGDIRFRNQL